MRRHFLDYSDSESMMFEGGKSRSISNTISFFQARKEEESPEVPDGGSHSSWFDQPEAIESPSTKFQRAFGLNHLYQTIGGVSLDEVVESGPGEVEELARKIARDFLVQPEVEAFENQFRLEQGKKQMKLPRTGFRCSCQKSHCMKMYCDCFRNQEVCGRDCVCRSCGNVDGELRDYVVEQYKIKNLGAFSTPENPSLKSPTKGCSCKNRKCLQRYCRCFGANRDCESHCACVGCQNTQGHKNLQSEFFKTEN